MSTPAEPTPQSEPDISEDEEKEVEGLQKPRPLVIYEVIRRDGEEELSRPFSSLWWSGVAAGIGISASVIAEGLLHKGLPETSWRPLVENFGYCLGFLLVIAGRLQLFTENTITAVLPLAAQPTRKNFTATLRLWGVVLAANLVGTLVFAIATVFAGIFSPDQVSAFVDISHHLMEKTPDEMLLHAIPAGFLIAALVWMLPNSKGSEIWVIIVMTYLIALGGFTHVVAGSAEVFLLWLVGDVTLPQVLIGFLVPAFVGNVIGGTVLFALLAYAQVHEEM